MAALVTVNIIATLEGLGKRVEFADRADDGTTPTGKHSGYPTIAVADTSEAVQLGDVAVVTLFVAKAVGFDVEIDLDFVSTFNADFTLKVGEPACVVPTPAGVIHFKNSVSSELCILEYEVFGTK